MADDMELLEVEILESRIRRLESDNQTLLQEKERLISAASHLESTNSHLESANSLLVHENERLRVTVADLQKTRSDLERALESLKIDLEDRERTLELERLLARTHIDDIAVDQNAIDEKNEQIERLISEIQELERNDEEDLKQLRKAEREREALARENERLEGQIDRITEENTVVILTLLTTQSDLETDLEKQTEIIRKFFQRAVEMVRRTVETIEGRGGVDGSNGGDVTMGEGGTDSTVEMMLQALEAELAGVKRAFWRIAGNVREWRPTA